MLVNCAAYQEGRKLGDIQVREIGRYLDRPNAFVWVGLKDPDDQEIDSLQAVFDLNPLAVEDAKHGHQRPKLEEYGDSLFVVAHVIELNDGELSVGEAAIFAGERYVVSVRRNAARGFGDVRARCEHEPELLRHGPGYVLYALLDSVVDRYFPILDSLETRLEEVEERIFADRATPANIEDLYDLKRKLTVVKHATDPLLEATSRLFGGRVPKLCFALQDYFRDIYDHLVRLDQSVDSLRDTATTAISVNLSLITIQAGEVTKRFAAYGALVAVPTMIAGVYGMNFEHMPELHWVYGYPLSILAMVAIDAYLFYRFKRAKWL